MASVSKNELHYFRASAALLATTAAAKLYSVGGSARILGATDELLHLNMRFVMIASAALELVVGWILVRAYPALTRAAALLWLSGNFLAYRVANHAANIKYCPCLGTVAQRVPINPRYLEAALNAVVLFWFFGSAYILWRAWSEKQEQTVEGIVAARDSVKQ